MNKKLGLMVSALFALTVAQGASADCKTINAMLDTGITAANDGTFFGTDGGYPLAFWITAVDESGMVCAVKTNGVSGSAAGNNEWLGSRVISAQKANTANAFSLDGYVISTANLYTPVQPGNSLYGLQHSNPVDASRAYGGSPNTYGTNSDFLKNKRIGGVNVFGGGLALYKNGKKVGAIGVSGDTSCADHIYAWEVRAGMGMEPYGNQTTNGSLQGIAGDNAVGITTVNLSTPVDTNTGALTGAHQGDEMIISGTTGANAYWRNWEHAACPNTVLDHPGVLVNGSF